MKNKKLYGLPALTPEYRKEDKCWGFWFSSTTPYSAKRIRQYPNVSHWWVWFKTKKECVSALRNIKRSSNDLSVFIQEGVAYPIVTKEFLLDSSPIRTTRKAENYGNLRFNKWNEGNQFDQ